MTSTKNVSRVIDKLNSKELKLTSQLKLANADAVKLGATIKQIQSQRMGLAIGQSKIAQAKAGRSAAVSSLTGSMPVPGAALGVAGALFPIKQAIDFEAAMSRVKAVSADMSDGEFKQLNSMARDLGMKTEFSATQAAEGMKFLSMAGMDTNAVLQATPAMLDLASASGMDLGRTADVASNIMSGFGKEASQMGGISDVLAKTLTTSNVDLEMLSDTFKYVAPAAKTAGVSFEQTSAMVGLLGDVGIQGSQAGTTLRAAMIRLSAPTAEAEKRLAGLGVATKDSQGNLRQVPEILFDIFQKTKDLGTADMTGAFKDIFGKNAFSGMAELVSKAGGKQMKSLQEYMAIVQDSAGTAKKIAAANLDNTAGAIKKMNSALEGLSISASTAFLPVVTGAANIVASFAAWTAENEGLTSTLFNVSAAILGGVIAVKLLKIGYYAVAVPLQIVRQSLRVLRAQKVLNTIATTRLGLAQRVAAVGTIMTICHPYAGVLEGFVANVVSMSPPAGGLCMTRALIQRRTEPPVPS